jgi:hypothetical protein
MVLNPCGCHGAVLGWRGRPEVLRAVQKAAGLRLHCMRVAGGALFTPERPWSGGDVGTVPRRGSGQSTTESAHNAPTVTPCSWDGGDCMVLPCRSDGHGGAGHVPRALSQPVRLRWRTALPMLGRALRCLPSIRPQAAISQQGDHTMIRMISSLFRHRRCWRPVPWLPMPGQLAQHHRDGMLVGRTR